MYRPPELTPEVEELVFAFYTKHTGEPSYVFMELAEAVTKVVAARCADIADEADNADGWQIPSKWIRAEFNLE